MQELPSIRANIQSSAEDSMASGPGLHECKHIPAGVYIGNNRAATYQCHTLPFIELLESGLQDGWIQLAVHLASDMQARTGSALTMSDLQQQCMALAQTCHCAGGC